MASSIRHENVLSPVSIEHCSALLISLNGNQVRQLKVQSSFSVEHYSSPQSERGKKREGSGLRLEEMILNMTI